MGSRFLWFMQWTLLNVDPPASHPLAIERELLIWGLVGIVALIYDVKAEKHCILVTGVVVVEPTMHQPWLLLKVHVIIHLHNATTTSTSTIPHIIC